MDAHEISAFIIAGGRSRRFGEDKALFDYRGMPLIQHVAESIKPAIGKIAIVADDAERFAFLGIPCYRDIIPGMGPFGGLHAALTNADTVRIFVFACDMPGLDADLIRYMAAESEQYDVTVPYIEGRYEPLHAVYSKSCLAPVEKRIRDVNRRIISFYGNVSVRPILEQEILRFIDPKLVFRNINYRHEAET